MLTIYTQVFRKTFFYSGYLVVMMLSLFECACNIAPVHHTGGALDSTYNNAKILYFLDNGARIGGRAWLNPFARHSYLYKGDSVTLPSEYHSSIYRGLVANSSDFKPSVCAPISVDSGVKMELYLEDSSSVLLNSRSVLYHGVYHDPQIRENCLMGEALFHVRSGKEKFVIYILDSAALTISADSGTFLVTAYPEDSVIRIISKTGDLTVDGQHLRPGKAFDVNPTTWRIHEIDADTLLLSSLGENQLRFDNVGKRELMNRIARWYGLKVVLPQKLDSNGYTGIYDTDNLDSLQKELSMQDLKTTVQNNTITLF